MYDTITIDLKGLNLCSDAEICKIVLAENKILLSAFDFKTQTESTYTSELKAKIEHCEKS